MGINRRNFLKIAGATGIGSMLPNRIKGGDIFIDADQHPPNALKNIYLQAYKKHPQKFNMCGYAAPKLDTVRVGFVGVGSRGSAAVQRLSYIDGVEIVAICDELETAAQKAKARIKTPGHPAIIYAGKEDSWKEMCRRDDIDLVYVATPWALHVPVTIYAMEQGKHAAMEVPAAKTIEECWGLVETSEKTKKHCIVLENCCYDFFELLTLNLARNGFFGDVVHAEGAYIHEIGESLFHRGEPGRRWRLNENIGRNGSLYPTHGIGPVAQAMNINRGNQMDYMVSMSSNDFMMNEYAKEFAKKDDEYKQYIDAPFRGNMNTSVIRTVKGQTILIQHDVTTPRPYSRLHTISGTKAIAQKYPLPGRIAIGRGDWLQETGLKELEEKYNPPIVTKMQHIAKEIGGHGGMDFLMDWRMIDCLRNGLPVDMDVYDAAAWSVITPLSEWSVANRSAPIDIPDFTNGSWKKNIPHDISLQHGGNTQVREDIKE